MTMNIPERTNVNVNVTTARTVNVTRKRQTNPGEQDTSDAWIRYQEPGTSKHLNRKRKQRAGPGKRNDFPNWGYGENMVVLHSTSIYLTNYIPGDIKRLILLYLYLNEYKK